MTEQGAVCAVFSQDFSCSNPLLVATARWSDLADTVRSLYVDSCVLIHVPCQFSCSSDAPDLAGCTEESPPGRDCLVEQ